MNRHLKYVIYRGVLCLYYSKNSDSFRYNLGVSFKHYTASEIKRVTNSLKKRIIPDELSDYKQEIENEVLKLSNLIQTFNSDYGQPPSIIELKKLISVMKHNSYKFSDDTILSHIADFVESYNRFFQKKKEDFEETPASLKDYKSFINSIIDFELFHKRKLSINSFNAKTINQYYEFLRTPRPSDENYLTKGMLDGKTIQKRFNTLSAFFNWINFELDNKFEKELFLLKKSLKQIDLSKITKEVPKIKLTLEQINLIKNCPLQEGTPEYKSREMFLVALYTGMRISDIITLNKKHIITTNKDGETFYFLQRDAVKTKGKYTVLLDDYINDILMKNDYNMKLMSPQKANLYLKKFLSTIPEFQKETEWGKIDTNNRKRNLKLYEIISFHQARRTFITTLLDKGFSISEAMERTDHVKVSTFEKYVSNESGLNIKKLNLYEK